MRKFILIAGFVLASASVQAADRSLSLAGSDPTAAAPAKVQRTAEAVEAPQAEAPKYQERPALVEPKAEPRSQGRAETPRTEQPAADSARPAPRKSASREKRRGRYWTEARIIRELNRHGIYW